MKFCRLFRVGITPEGAAELAHHGHCVLVESDAGLGIGDNSDKPVH
jgi:alanine dehydrogenase